MLSSSLTAVGQSNARGHKLHYVCMYVCIITTHKCTQQHMHYTALYTHACTHTHTHTHIHTTHSHSHTPHAHTHMHMCNTHTVYTPGLNVDALTAIYALQEPLCSVTTIDIINYLYVCHDDRISIH